MATRKTCFELVARKTANFSKLNTSFLPNPVLSHHPMPTSHAIHHPQFTDRVKPLNGAFIPAPTFLFLNIAHHILLQTTPSLTSLISSRLQWLTQNSRTCLLVKRGVNATSRQTPLKRNFWTVAVRRLFFFKLPQLWITASECVDHFQAYPNFPCLNFLYNGPYRAGPHCFCYSIHTSAHIEKKLLPVHLMMWKELSQSQPLF